MALIKPELEELQSETYSQMAGKLCPEDSFIRGGLIRIFSQILSYLAWSNYVFAENLGRTPWDATGEFLLNWGLSCGISPTDETCASGYVNVTGSGIIPNGAIMTRCDGVQYNVVGETLAPGQVLVEAIDCGLITNSPNGTILTFNGSYPGVSTTGVVDSNSLTGGTDAETEDEFRARVISCLANPCRTGLVSDYDFWARLHPGVSRVCVQPKSNGPGTVKIAFAMDDIYFDGIPAQQDVEIVQDIIEENAPLGVCAFVCAVKPEVIDVTVGLEYSTIAERTAIETALKEGFQSIDCGGLCYGDLFRMVSSVYPKCFEIVEPQGNIDFPFGCIPVLGTLTFVSI